MMKGKTKTILSLVVVLSLAGVAGAYYAFRTDPKVAKVLDIGKQMEGLPREERGKLFGEMRAAMEELTPDQRDQIRQQMFSKGRNEWRAREQKKMNEFLAMSKKDRIKALDKELDAMVKRQKDREKRRREAQQQAQASGQTGGQGGGGGGGNQQGGRGGFGGPGGGGTGDRSLNRRLAMDNTSANQQAQSSEYRRMLSDRAAQRGIAFTGGGGRR
jgi:hypothetical protein